SIFAQQSLEHLKQIERALGMSQNMPVGMLAMAIAFAMRAVCSEPPSEIATSMAAALVGMLKKESSATSDKGTLSSVDPAVLGSVGRVVSRFTAWGAAIVEHAWLTTRLYEWWILQVEVADVRDLHEPDDGSWQRLRTEVALNIMLDMLEATVIVEKRVPILP